MGITRKYILKHRLVGEIYISKEKYLRVREKIVGKLELDSEFSRNSFVDSKSGFSGYIKSFEVSKNLFVDDKNYINSSEVSSVTNKVKLYPNKVSLRDKLEAGGIL